MTVAIRYVDGPRLARGMQAASDWVSACRDELNRINVFPVPDGDTGTNMALTLESVSAAIGTAVSMEEVCHAIGRGSLMGARGNSGVITSQILRGLVDVFQPLEAIDPAALRAALRRGADAAYAWPFGRACATEL